LAILPPILAVVLTNTHFCPPQFPVLSRFMIVFVLFYYLIIFSYIFLSFLTWFYNFLSLLLIELSDIDYSDVVIHDMAETKLSHIEDVRYTQSGFVPHF